ncbi:MAG: M3 family metallopeptidase [Granulosicoccus sp.]
MTESLLINRPSFSAIDVATIEAQLDKLLKQARETVEQVAKVGNPDWQTLIQPVSEAQNAISLFWSPISHLNSVMNNDELRDVYNRCLPILSDFHTELGQNRQLYNATLSLKNSAGFNSLNEAQQQEVRHSIREFELGGVSLDDKNKQRFGEIAKTLSRLTTEYSDHVLDATKAWSKIISDENELAGMPESAVAAARQRAQVKGQDGWLLNLEFPTYHAVMTFADNQALRREMYTAYVTRASDQGPQADQFDNSLLMDEILRLRAEKAALLDYSDYAELSMVRKMVESPQQVLEFLNDLATRSVDKARAEFSELEAYARNQLKLESLAAWDIAFVSDHLKKQRHDLSDEDLKPYFPTDKVIPGMFQVIGKLFGLTIEQVSGVDVYHPDVSYYSITDKDGQHRGDFYLDNYARENKRGGAWMDVCTTRQRIGQQIQLPIAYLTCNLTPPVGEDPALLTHMEVTTLFHEFGHGLHHMLTRIEAAGVSGINGVEWDAVELPSQFLENWCWERESLDMISGHYQTGEKLPDALLSRLRNARNFQSAMQLVRQLEFSLFDMQIHLESTADNAADIQATLDTVRSQVAAVPTPEFNRFQNGFSHIFAGGYAAGYFSYKWAEVLSSDAFARFEQDGIFDMAAGRDFLVAILEKGGSRDAMQSYIAFKGKKPTVDALLRHTGLAA